MTPQKMMETLLAPGFEGDGKLSNDLLSEFHKGFPMENLRLLLASRNEATHASGAFIATFFRFELRPFLAELTALLDSSDTHTRFDMIEALNQCTTPDDGEILGRMLLQLDDPWHGVRWKVVQFLATTERRKLRQAVHHAAKLQPNSDFALVLKEYKSAYAMEDLRVLVSHASAIVRRFGAAMAIRPRQLVLEQHLLLVQQSGDAELETIAGSAAGGYLSGTCSSFARAEILPWPNRRVRRSVNRRAGSVAASEN